MRKLRVQTLLVAIIGLFTVTSIVQAQQKKVLDRIVAVVNNHIILKSDVDSVLAQYLQQSQQQSNQVHFSKKMWYSALESEIDKYVLLEKAKIDSVTVTDQEVDRALNQRIDQMEKQAGGKKALENYFGKSIVELKSQWRSLYRQDALVNKVRQDELKKIDISRAEVVNFYNSIPKDSLPTIPETVKLAQIVKIPPPDKDAEEAARKLAKELRDSIVVYHKSFSTMAERWSQGPSASRGGRIGLVSVKDLVPEYAAAAAALQPGQISHVVRSSFGYHIIRLNKRVGDKIDTDQILIKVDKDRRDDKQAITFLNQIRDSVLKYHKSFADMARKYSDDQATAPTGGILANPQTQNQYLELTNLQPSLYRIVLLLDKKGEISEPKPYTIQNPEQEKAYRIVQLKDRVKEHKANLQQDYDLIKNYALQQKQEKEMSKWMQNLRNQIYVEYLIPVPKNDNTLGLNQHKQQSG